MSIRTAFLSVVASLPLLVSTSPAQTNSPIQYPTTKMAKMVNEYRARHGVPDLKVSNELAPQAQKWAERGKFEHSGGGSEYGENLWVSSDECNEKSLQRAVDSWYEEAEKYGYDYDHPDTKEADQKEFDKGVGHFTQLVWKNSENIGVGAASHPDQKWKCLVVAQFSPPGNYMGEFRENVLPPE